MANRPSFGRAMVALFLASLACLQQANNQALAAQSAPVADAGAAGAPAPTNCATVSIKVLPFEVTRNFSVSMREFHDMRRKWSSTATSASAESTIVGFVQTAPAFSASSMVSAGCAAYDFTVGYTPATLYVASDLARNPCAFNHVLQHEEHHVQLYETGLQILRKEASDSLRTRLEQELAGLPTAQGRKVAMQVLSDRMQQLQQPHIAFDSLVEYEKNRSACDGAIERISLRASRFR